MATIRSSCGSRALYTVPKAPIPTDSISSKRPSRRWPPRGLQVVVDSRFQAEGRAARGADDLAGGQTDQLDWVAAVRAADMDIHAGLDDLQGDAPLELFGRYQGGSLGAG